MDTIDPSTLENGIAIIGMSARFPGAHNVDEFWSNVRDGVESLDRLSEDELLAKGVPESLIKNPNYIPVSGSLPEVEMFDAGYFGFSPKDAAITDPQHRHFLECAVEAFESAGHSTHRFDGSIGVFAGCGMNSYFVNNLLTNPDMMRSVGSFLLRHTGNDRDFLPTTVSYKLNLTGPSMAIQTACSTSLVAIHAACQSLLGGECEMAVAGGSTILVPNGQGYLYRENEPVSPDGHCRPFEAQSAGTVLSSGTGVVVLRRLEDALADGDPIQAVIRGSAVNNDGAGKVGYMAPSVDGHASVVAEALAVADVSADTISYVEAHGTGTRVGDPIEISALTAAFRASTDRNQFCRIGSVKSNIGHLDTAAGVASLIKVVKSMQAEQMAPTLHFKQANPEIDFASTPFEVNAELRAWETGSTPRRAGVSSLGIGGTNAHIVLEEAPAQAQSDSPAREQQALVLSAKSQSALDSAADNLMNWLRENPDASLADVAYTLQEGRDYWEHRLVISASTVDEAIEALAQKTPAKVFKSKAGKPANGVAFMFSGAGGQYPNMARGLYESEPAFRTAMDECLALLQDMLDYDLKPLLYPEPSAEAAANTELQLPSRLCPAVVATEWALAQLWKSWGIEPSSMIGHSLGEYVVACMAGVFSLKDMLQLVVLRGNLIDSLSGGAMLSLPMSEEEARAVVGTKLDIAAVNSPGLCVASGLQADVEALAASLAEQDIETRVIPVNAAGHSRHLDPILEAFREGAQRIKYSAPAIPYVSNVSGNWAKAEEVSNADYWVKHLRGTVRFADGLDLLVSHDDIVLLEVGPGQGLCTFARQQEKSALGIVPSLRKVGEEVQDREYAVGVFARLWANGAEVEWQALRGTDEARRRIPLPTYPFEHQPYWVEPGTATVSSIEAEKYLKKIEQQQDWYKRLAWQETFETGKRISMTGSWLVFVDDAGVGQKLVQQLEAAGADVTRVTTADTFLKVSDLEYALAPELGREGYDQLISALAESDRLPEHVVHLWSLTPDMSFRPGSSFLDRTQESGFYSLLHLMQAVADADESIVSLDVITNGLAAVSEDESVLYPQKGTLLGPVRVIPREFPQTSCRCIDLSLPVTKPKGLHGWVGLESVSVDESVASNVATQIFEEISTAGSTAFVAWRRTKRFAEVLAPKRAEPGCELPGFRKGGVYLVTGGLGGLGFALSTRIAERFGARMVLIGRSGLPDEAAWDDWLANHGDRDSTIRKIQAIRALRNQGGDMLPLTADVTDASSMRRVVETAEAKFGPINGVLHAAASVSDGVLQTKTKEGAEQTFAAKLYGTLVLDELFANKPLDFMLLFSSTSAIVGLPGQVDYAAANAYLNAFAEARTKSGRRTIAIDWGIWHEVGGAVQLAQSIEHGQSEVTYARSTNHPLLGECTENGPTAWRWEASWRTQELWILDEHRNEDQIALLPGTGYLELARAAFADARGTENCEIADLAFLQPLVVGDDDAQRVAVELKRQNQDFQLRIFSVDSGDEHATMTLRPVSTKPRGNLSLTDLKSRCTRDHLVADGDQTIPSSQEAQLGFGPRWSSLREIGFSDQEAFARLKLNSAYEDDCNTFKLHPGLLDIATSFGIPMIRNWQNGQSIYVPLAYGTVRVLGPITAEIYAHIANDPANTFDRDVASFDITLTDAQGRILVEIDRYQMRKLDAHSGFGSTPVKSGRGHVHEPTPTEAVFLESYANGITLDEGLDALTHSLTALPAGVTVVSPINIADWEQRIAAACASNDDEEGVTFARPDLDSEYIAPRDDLENELVKLWREFLGVDQIGIQDDFFDLGGHSLIAVRLFAKLKKQWGVDWPISVLFDAPSIEPFANLLRAEIGDVVATSDETDEAAAPQLRHRYLVSMNKSNNSNRAPLFLVAGMFGNVLNLRHLATHLGDDQPVYALQAKGLYGDDEPHRTFVDAARDYIEEMRHVQPHGPYLVGGFSGGGVTAFEIAHQLLADGEEVSALVMLDSIPPHPAWPEPDFMDRLHIQLQRTFKVMLRDPTAWLKRRIRWELEKRGHACTPRQSTPAEFRSELIEIAFRESLACYEMKQLPVRLSLFRPELDDTYHLRGDRIANRDGQLMENLNWWSPWTSEGIDVEIVPGNHDSMVLEPNVKVLAALVRKTLDEAQPAEEAVVENGTDTQQPGSVGNTQQGVRYAS